MKRSLAALLCAMLFITLLPTTAFAAGESAIQLGTGGIGANDRIYFGKYALSGTDYDVPWFVLSMNATANSALLLSECLLGDSAFGSGSYSTSSLKGAMEAIYSGFESGEQAAVKPTDLTDVSVTAARLFPLSEGEAEAIGWGNSLLKAKYINAVNENAGGWWLRTIIDFGSSGSSTYASRVKDDGEEYHGHIYSLYGVRPAFNLDLSKVLFTAAADNSGQNATFSAPAAYSGTNWKLTIKDGNSFAAGTAKTSGNTALTTGYAAEALTFDHAALSSFTGAGYTNVTAALTNAAGDLLYYGSINTTLGATSSTVTIPAGLAAGSYTLSLYAEDRNAVNSTDFATGTPFTQTITVAAPSASIGNVTVSGSVSSGVAITPVDAAITLTNERFNALAADTDVSGWFTNLPNGLAAKIKTAVAANATIATVTFTGIALASRSAAMAVTIPAASLIGNAALTVTANANAKWAIIAPSMPAITDPTADQIVSVAVGSTATFSVTAVNATGYRWQVNRGSGFETIPGATGASYTTAPVTLQNNGYQYYCVVTNGGNNSGSPIFTLNVSGPVEIPIPKTGDDSMPLLWLYIALMAGLGLVLGVGFMGRKRRRNN